MRISYRLAHRDFFSALLTRDPASPTIIVSTTLRSMISHESFLEPIHQSYSARCDAEAYCRDRRRFGLEYSAPAQILQGNAGILRHRRYEAQRITSWRFGRIWTRRISTSCRKKHRRHTKANFA